MSKGRQREYRDTMQAQIGKSVRLTHLPTGIQASCAIHRTAQANFNEAKRSLAKELHVRPIDIVLSQLKVDVYKVY